MNRKNEKVSVHQQPPMRLRVLTIVALVVMVVAGVFIAHLVVPSPYLAAQNRAIGSNISVSGSMVPNAIKAVGTKTSRTPFVDTQPLGPMTQITPVGKLPAPMTLHFKLSRQVKTGEVAFLATSEAPGGPWTLLQPIISGDGWYASIQTTHLSFWQPLLYDLKAAAAEFKKQVLDGLSGDMITEAEKPHCDNESQARQDDYTITSSAKNTLYWCFGVENGQRVLKIVNRERYPLEVSHVGFTVLHASGPTLDFEQLARLGSGQMTILYPFDEVDYTLNLQPGQQALIDTDFSGYAQSLYQLEVGVSTLVDILGRFGAGGGIVNDGKITFTFFDKVIEAMGKILSIKDCANVLFNLSIGQLISGCFDPAAIMEAFGWKGLLLAPLMAIGSLVEFFHSSLNAVVDIHNGSDQYQILVNRFDPTAVFDSYVGAWHVHGYDLTIKSDRTGQDIWHDGFSPSGDWCNGNDSITFTVMPDGSLVGTVENSWYTPANDGCSSGDWQPGDRFTLVHQGNHLLYQTWEPPVPDANYLCDTYAAGQGWGQCGA